MTIELRLMAWLLSVSLVMGGLFGVYKHGRHVEGLERDKIAAAQFRAVSETITGELTKNDLLKTELETKHAENQKIVDDLHTTINRLRIVLPKTATCGDNSQTDTSSGSKGGAAGAGALPADAQESLDRFTAGVADLAHEADTLTESCRVVIDWARRQGAL